MFYLYFVLPPVIIVVSLALIIFLVSRKSLEIEKKITEDNANAINNESQLSMEVKSKGLYFLEKLAHWFKIFSLKMHNWLEEKLKFIKQRKVKINSNKKKNGEKYTDDKQNLQNKEIEKENIYTEVKKKKLIEKIFQNINEKRKLKKDAKRAKKSDTEEKERVEVFKQKAIISKEVTYPEEKKEELENILIERIATDPRDIEAYERLGDYYVSQKNYKDAKECYRQVLKLNPRSVSIKKKLENFGR